MARACSSLVRHFCRFRSSICIEPDGRIAISKQDSAEGRCRFQQSFRLDPYSRVILTWGPVALEEIKPFLQEVSQK
jgi:hypothetical protein